MASVKLVLRQESKGVDDSLKVHNSRLWCWHNHVHLSIDVSSGSSLLFKTPLPSIILKFQFSSRFKSIASCGSKSIWLCWYFIPRTGWIFCPVRSLHFHFLFLDFLNLLSCPDIFLFFVKKVCCLICGSRRNIIVIIVSGSKVQCWNHEGIRSRQIVFVCCLCAIIGSLFSKEVSPWKSWRCLSSLTSICLSHMLQSSFSVLLAFQYWTRSLSSSFFGILCDFVRCCFKLAYYPKQTPHNFRFSASDIFTLCEWSTPGTIRCKSFWWPAGAMVSSMSEEKSWALPIIQYCLMEFPSSMSFANTSILS